MGPFAVVSPRPFLLLLVPTLDEIGVQSEYELREKLKKMKERKNLILREKQKRLGVTPLDFIREHDKQLLLTCSNRINRWFLGGNRTGKTEWGAHECARFLHKRHPAIDLVSGNYKNENVEGWACCPSYDVQVETTQPKLLACLNPDRIVETYKLRHNIISSIKYKADDGTISSLSFKSYEQGREKFQGAGKHFIWFDEEPPLDVYEEATIRSKAGFPLYTYTSMTPVNGMTWVYDKIYLNTEDPNLHVITAEWNDNVFLTEEQKAQMRARYTDEALQVREKGLFVQRTGLVCSWFRRDVHMRDDILSLIPKGSDVYLGIDFGFSRPCCALYVAVDYDMNLYVFDGIYRTGLTTPQLKEILERKEQAIKDAGLQMRTRFADSAQAQDIAQLNKAHFPVTPVEKSSGVTKEGWDEFRARIMDEAGRVNPRTDKSKILFSTTLVGENEDGKVINWMLNELENLRWEERRRDGVLYQKPRWKDTNPKHAIDALTYVIAMLAAPPDKYAQTRERQEREALHADDMASDGWALYEANPFGFLLPKWA